MGKCFARGSPGANYTWAILLEVVHALAYRDDDDEHERGAVGVPELLGLLGLSAGRLPLAAVEQSLPLPLRLLHRPEQQDVEHDEHRARHQVHEQHAEPAMTRTQQS